MQEVRDLLGRFKNILSSKEVKRESVRAAILKVAGISIGPSEIEIKGGDVYLKTKPIYRNEIFLKKEKIFSELKETFGEGFEAIR